MTTRKPGRPWKAAATALPAKPKVLVLPGRKNRTHFRKASFRQHAGTRAAPGTRSPGQRFRAGCKRMCVLRESVSRPTYGPQTNKSR